MSLMSFGQIFSRQKAIRLARGESINIGSGKKYSVKEIAKIIGGETEFLPPRIEPKDSLADISLGGIFA